MNTNKKLSVGENPKELLEVIKQIHGIDLIRDFIKSSNKLARRKNKSVNSYVKIAIYVYELVHHEGYCKTRAIEKVADIYSLKDNTVRNHCA